MVVVGVRRREGEKERNEERSVDRLNDQTHAFDAREALPYPVLGFLTAVFVIFLRQQEKEHVLKVLILK